MPVHGGIPIHAPQHEDGGIDEIDVTDLSGLLADDQHVLDAEVLAVAAALVHAGQHENGGADEISVAGLSGLLADDQNPVAHAVDHENGGGDEIDVVGLSGLLADDQHVLDAEVLAVAAALVHAGRHENGGLDEIDVVGLSGLLADDQHVLDAEVLAVAAAIDHNATHEPGGADEVRGIDLPNVPGADETGWGIETTDTVGEIVEAGEICYMKADGKYWLADADAAATMPALVMAMEDLAADASGRLLHIGYMRQDAWDWTLANGEANLLWASVTPGAMSPDQPVGAGDQVQVVAYIKSADVVFFNPSYELVEVS